MSHDSITLPKPPAKLDYSLTGVNSRLAIERGLAEADWYQCAVSREKMRQLLVRSDGPALRDEAVKHDCPVPYRGLVEAYREIVPAILRQVKDPAYHVKRELPDRRIPVSKGEYSSDAKADSKGWIEVCAAADLGAADILRFDYGKKSYALIRDATGKLRRRRLYLNLHHPGGAGARIQQTYHLRVVSNSNVANSLKSFCLSRSVQPKWMDRAHRLYSRSPIRELSPKPRKSESSRILPLWSPDDDQILH